MPKLVIFGNAQMASLAHYYFTHDSPYEIIAFTVDEAYMNTHTLEGLPVIPLPTALEQYPPDQYAFFVAMGYTQMNRLREHKYQFLKEKGYQLATYKSTKCTWLSQHEPGDNCFILEDNTIQPYSRIYNNVVLWSGNHIGHHAVIEDHTFVTSHVVVSGNVKIGHHSFLGVNASIADGVEIAPYTLAGAGVTLTKNTMENGVYVPEKAILLDKKSEELI